jgi:hypothetical protein
MDVLEVSSHPRHHHVSHAKLGSRMSGLKNPGEHSFPLPFGQFASSLIILQNDGPAGQALVKIAPVREGRRTARPTATGHNNSMRILFLHGWRSVPGGVKPSYLAQHGHEVINPKLPDEDFARAVRIAQDEFDKHQPDVIIGSSRGGAVAMNLDSGDTPLVLLCPAWKKYGKARTVKENSTILHSRADDVVPFSDSEALVRNSGLPASVLIEVGNDHRLADPEPLKKMLEACEGVARRKRNEQIDSMLLHPQAGNPEISSTSRLTSL